MGKLKLYDGVKDKNFYFLKDPVIFKNTKLGNEKKAKKIIVLLQSKIVKEKELEKGYLQ